jgi:alpha-beta hydrolase superfamily lysophospholipase
VNGLDYFLIKFGNSRVIEQQITANDGHNIQVYVWPNQQAKAWIHINHGMAEHALRYTNFAGRLVEAGYAVVAHNHRGHGNSEQTQLGCLARHQSWQNVLSDIDEVRLAICGEKPYFLFGHSMGSFIVQSYLIQSQREINGLILSASNLQPTSLSRVGSWVASFEKMRLGEHNSSALLQFLSFGSFNSAFKPARTEFDWLSRDAAQVDKYITDPLCGFACSTGFWHAFLTSLVALYKTDMLKTVQANLPMLLLGGSDDPVGLMGKGLPKLAQAYKTVGQSNITLKLYDKARHEILNETNHQQVKLDVINWLDSQNTR